MAKKKKKPLTGFDYNSTTKTVVGGIVALELIKKI